MLWILTVLVASFLRSAYYNAEKVLTSEYDELELSYISVVLGLVFMTPVGLYGALKQPVNVGFFTLVATLLSGVANLAGFYLYLHVLGMEEISVAEPLKRLTPVIVAVTEPLILGTNFSFHILLGAVLAFLGAYVVLIDGKNFLEPFRRIRDKGIYISLFLSVIYAVAALSDRYATTRISPYLFSFLIYAIMASGYLAMTRYRGNEVASLDQMLEPRLLGLGLLTAVSSLLIFYTYSLAAASKVSVGLQSIIVFSILIGGVAFKEDNILRKLVGSIVIISGILLVI